MKLSRKWILVIALVMSLTMATAGTLAYLTDREEATNTFTVGKVDIVLDEGAWDPSVDHTLLPGVNFAKAPKITNTGNTDAWVWMKITLPTGMMKYIDWNTTDWKMSSTASNGETTVTLKRTTLLPDGEDTAPAFTKVEIPTEVTDVSDLGDGVIDVIAYAIQGDVATTIDAAITAYGTNGGTGSGTPSTPGKTTEWVSTADELTDALAAGNDVKLTADIELENDTTITIGSGKDVNLDLNGKELSANNTRTETHNFMIDVKGGTLNISDGTITMQHTGTNMAWNGATTVIDVTAGGVLNLDGVTIENLGGTDMNFAVHLNNWGEVTLNAENSTLKATYIAVRVFNSGPNMNNVTIKNSKLEGKYAFWVHNYGSEDFGGKLYSGSSEAYNAELVAARLNFNILNNGNTMTVTGKAPILYGFNDTIYYDANGNVVE